MAWYGWIPILTSRILFEKCIERLEENTNKNDGLWTKPSEEDKKLLDKALGKNNGTYYMGFVNEDKENKEFKFVISVDNYKIDHIAIFDEGNRIVTHAECNFINDTSLVSIQWKEGLNPLEEKKKAQQIYAKIRDVYHLHTHHEKPFDLLLNPIEEKSLSEVGDTAEFEKIKKYIILKILEQYEWKIIEYLKIIKDDVKEYEEDARKMITMAKGEMKYASSFVNLFKEEIGKRYDSYVFIFSNALECIDILAHDIEAAHEERLNKEVHKLTYLLTVFTVIIALLTAPTAIDVIYNSVIHNNLPYLGVLLGLVVFVLLVVLYIFQRKNL